MDAQLKAKWIEALRSGEYKQGDGKLHNTVDDSYCCLGVLCKVMGAVFTSASEEASDEEYGFSEYDYVPLIGERVLSPGEDQELKKSVCEEIGIPDQHHLIALNDGWKPREGDEIPKHSFAEIADYIEANIPSEGLQT